MSAKSAWATLRSDFVDFKSMIAMRGLADYIVHAFLTSDQDKIIEGLTNPKMQTHVRLEIYFTERESDYLTKSAKDGE